jgi:hypothetical protein
MITKERKSFVSFQFSFERRVEKAAENSLGVKNLFLQIDLQSSKPTDILAHPVVLPRKGFRNSSALNEKKQATVEKTKFFLIRKCHANKNLSCVKRSGERLLENYIVQIDMNAVRAVAVERETSAAR